MIKEYSGNYNKKEFYGVMGKFFAEPFYKHLLPYLKNDDGYIWLLNKKNGQVIAFTAYKIKESKIEFAVDFYERNIDDLKELTELKLEQVQGLKKPIETATTNPLMYEMFVEMGFKEYKATTNYRFLIKEEEDV